MKILICGDRNYKNKNKIKNFLKKVPKNSTIINGGCRGADLIAQQEAKELKLNVETYPAEWRLYGRAAGPIRNLKMLNEGKPNFVIAFHNNIEESKGTKNMLKISKKANVKTFVVDFSVDSEKLANQIFNQDLGQ